MDGEDLGTGRARELAMRVAGLETIRLLGRGGMGIVYLARQPSLDRLVALKVLRSGPFTSEELVARFTREARAAALTHPHIVPIYDYGEWEEGFFISMGYLPGGSLADQLQQGGSIPPDRVAAVGAQIASALAYAHGKGVVHRDVKPSNVMLDEEGNAFLADFGIAHIAASTRLTSTAQFIGTPNYMAPELAKGEKATPASDVYSLGATLYECLTGSPPFFGDDPQVVLYQHRFEEVPDLPQDVPAAVGLPVLRALAKDPADRFASSAAFARALRGQPEDVAGHPATVASIEEPSLAGPASPIPGTIPEAPATPVPAPVSSPAPVRRRRWPIVAVIAVAIAGAVGAAAITLGGDGDAEAEAPPGAVEGDLPAPTEVSADVAGPTEITLTWAFDPGEAEVLGFHVRSGDVNVSKNLIDSEAREFTAEDLEPATRSCFTVVALGPDGVESVSAEACARTQPLLRSPGNLHADVVVPDSVVLTWVDRSDGEDGYRVLVDGERRKELPADSVRATISGLAIGEHCFVVEAFGAGLPPAASDEICRPIVAAAAGEEPSAEPGQPDGGGNPGNQSPAPPPAEAPTPSFNASGSGLSVTLSWSAPGADEVCFTNSSSTGVAGDCFGPAGSTSVVVEPGSQNRWCVVAHLGGDESSQACDTYTATSSTSNALIERRSFRMTGLLRRF